MHPRCRITAAQIAIPKKGIILLLSDKSALGRAALLVSHLACTVRAISSEVVLIIVKPFDMYHKSMAHTEFLVLVPPLHACLRISCIFGCCSSGCSSTFLVRLAQRIYTQSVPLCLRKSGSYTYLLYLTWEPKHGNCVSVPCLDQIYIYFLCSVISLLNSTFSLFSERRHSKWISKYFFAAPLADGISGIFILICKFKFGKLQCPKEPSLLLITLILTYVNCNLLHNCIYVILITTSHDIQCPLGYYTQYSWHMNF